MPMEGMAETEVEALPKGGMHSGKGDGGNANNGMTEAEVMAIEGMYNEDGGDAKGGHGRGADTAKGKGMCDVDGDGDGASGRCGGDGGVADGRRVRQRRRHCQRMA